MKNSLTIPLAIITGGCIIAGAIYFSIAKSPAADLTIGNPALMRPLSASDHILGNPAAKVMIVEYSDFDCEYCKNFHETLHQLVANEGAKGDVAWTFRQFPLSEIHPNALSHALAAECAAAVGGNDAFWRFADILYANQPASPERYGALAQAANVPSDAFASCYANASTTESMRVASDRQNALDMGADGTPFSIIFVVGKPPVVMNGAYAYDAAKQLIDEALAN
ncbi:MAG: thioredoxin domain-containing protein [Candidatus Pacebacteria bacterium]|nr:thioredoxin domain-containing protein [Candidatus Paceibacterota bacterium]